MSQDAVYKLLKENPAMTYEEIAAKLNMKPKTASVHFFRLKTKGLVDRDDDGNVIFLEPEGSVLKAATYKEMLDIYMEDFRKQTTFVDRLSVGREIRLLMEKM